MNKTLCAIALLTLSTTAVADSWRCSAIGGATTLQLQSGDDNTGRVIFGSIDRPAFYVTRGLNQVWYFNDADSDSEEPEYGIAVTPSGMAVYGAIGEDSEPSAMFMCELT